MTGGDTRCNRGEDDGEDREQGIAGAYAPVPDSGAMPAKGEDTFQVSGNPLPDREAGCVSDATRMPLRGSSVTGCRTPSPSSAALTPDLAGEPRFGSSAPEHCADN